MTLTTASGTSTSTNSIFATAAATRRRTTTNKKNNKRKEQEEQEEQEQIRTLNIQIAGIKHRTSRGSDPDGTLLSSTLGQEHLFFHKQHRHDLDLLNPSMQPIPACDSNIIGRCWSQSIQTCSHSQIPPTPSKLVVLQES